MGFLFVFKRFLCFLLVLTVTFMTVVPPIQVRATDPYSAAVVGIELITGISIIMNGLGLFAGNNPSAFGTLASTIASELDAAWKFTSSAGVAMLRLITLGSDYYYASSSVVAFVLSKIHSLGAVISSVTADIPDGSPDVVSQILTKLCENYGTGYSHYFLCIWGNDYDAYLLHSPPTFPSNSAGRLLVNMTYTEKVTYGSGGYFRNHAVYDSTQTFQTFADTLTYWHGPLSSAYSSSTYEVDGLGDSLEDDVYSGLVAGAIASVAGNMYIPVTVPGTVGEDEKEETDETVPIDAGTIPGDVVLPTEPVPDETTDTEAGTVVNYTPWFEALAQWLEDIFWSVWDGFASVESWLAAQTDSLCMYQREPGFFRPKGIHMFCGEQGSGKTIAAVEMMLRLQKQYPKAKMITNFGVTTENDELQEWQQLLDYTNGHYGVIVGIDEIQNWFMSGLNKLPEGMLEVATQNRKNNRILCCTAQVFTRVNKGLREQVTMVYNPHTFLGCFTVVIKRKPVFDSEGNVIDSKYRGMYCFTHTEELRDAYDTYKVIHTLSKEGFKDPLPAPSVTNVYVSASGKRK